jgi:hypothetical protein
VQQQKMAVEWSHPLSLEQVIHQIFAFGRISALDRGLLQAVTATEPILGDRERDLLVQLCDAIEQGTLAIL